MPKETVSRTPAPLALAALATLWLIPPASADIGINFYGRTGTSGAALGPDLTAGAVPQAKWNNTGPDVDNGDTAAITSPVSGQLVDHGGQATGAAVFWSSTNAWNVPANHTGAPLFDGYLDNTQTANPTRVTVTGIPYASYDVYLYVGSDGNGRTGRTRINDDPATDRYYVTSTSPFGGHVEATATTQGTAAPSNTVRYADVTGSTLLVENVRVTNNTGLHGLQIVATAIVEGLPAVTTGSAAEVTSTSARLGGSVTDIGEDAPAVTIYYGPADAGVDAGAWEHSASVAGTPTGAFSAVVEDLAPATGYHFRAYAENSAGGAWAQASATFATLAEPPEVENLAATGVEAFKANVGGEVTSTGGQIPVLTIYYGVVDGGTDTAAWASSAPLGAVSGPALAPLEGLAGETTYFFRAFADNGAGSAWAPSSATFTTRAATPPAVTTDGPGGVTATTALLRGTVTDNGFDDPAVTVYYGTVDGGTDPAGWVGSVSAGVRGGAFSVQVGGLEPAATYFFRAFAQNAAGGSWAPAGRSFATPEDIAPTVVINEIHVDPPNKTRREEFVELYNAGDTAVDLSGWYFSNGIEFTFPAGVTLPAGGYAVVAENLLDFGGAFGFAPDGVFRGTLDNEGERLTLRDAAGVRVDEVDYGSRFPWPIVGDVPGYSYELINPGLDNDLGGSWRPSAGPDEVGGGGGESGLVPPDGVWRYLPGVAPPPVGWRDVAFDDGGWASGTAPLGYGENFITTQLDMSGEYSTVYFRRSFEIEDPSAVGVLGLGVRFDDGVNVWINGVHVAGDNVAGNELPHDATTGTRSEEHDFTPFTLANPRAYLRAGTNVIAAQIVNASLSGSSDAFFDARLDLTAGGGIGPTPGFVNSVFASNAPPQLRQVRHDPGRPAGGEPVTITVKASDPEGVGAVTLAYQLVEPGDYFAKNRTAPNRSVTEDPRYEDPANWTAVPMVDDGTGGDAAAGDGVYTAVLPGSLQVHRRLVRYRITAADGLGASVRAPYRHDPSPNFAYFVYDGVPAYTAAARPGATPEVTYPPELLESIPVYHLLTRRAEHLEALHLPNATSGTYGGSEYLWNGTLVYDGEVYDHINYRARGGVWRYSMGKNMWKFAFPRGHRFEARDDFGRRYKTSWRRLNFSALIQQGNFRQRGEQGIFEGAGFKLHNLAGNPAPLTHYVHFRVVERTHENGSILGGSQFDTDFQGLYMAIEQPDGRFLDEHGLPDGNFYKMEGGTGELNNQGPTHPTDKSDLNAFFAYKNSSQTADWWRQNLELDDYYNFRAIAMAIHDYDIHANKNYFYYHNAATDRWQVINWDLDLCWTTTYNGGGGRGPLNQHVLVIPEFATEYRNRVRELRDLLFNPDQTGMLIDEVVQWVYTPGEPSLVDADRAMWDYNPILTNTSYINSSKAGHGRYYEAASPRTFTGMVQLQKNYVASRGAWMDGNILTDRAQVPRTPTVTYAGPAGFPLDALRFTASAYSSPASSPFAALAWRIAEVSDPSAPGFDPLEPRRYEIDALWESGELDSSASTLTLPVEGVKTGLTYRVRARMKDAAGRWGHWSAPVQFVAGDPADLQDLRADLRISEVMYHPAPPNTAEADAGFTDDADFEFIELYNAGENALDLTQLRFTKGVDFDFATGATTTLPPGGYALVVSNAAAFAARYGEGLPVAGEWEDQRLSNGGERLKLSFGSGNAVHDFDYDDDPPWPGSADGGGRSLVLVAPDAAGVPAYASAATWRPSTRQGGSPGAADPEPGPGREAWRQEHFNAAEQADPAVSGDGADPDNDGVPNLFEFALGADPRDPASRRLPRSGSGHFDAGGGDMRPFLTLTFRRRTDAGPGIDYLVETSADLATWIVDATETAPATDNGDGTESVTVRDNTPLDAANRRFIRLRVRAE